MWSITSFNVPMELLKDGVLNVFVNIDSTHSYYWWAVTIGWSKLTVVWDPIKLKTFQDAVDVLNSVKLHLPSIFPAGNAASLSAKLDSAIELIVKEQWFAATRVIDAARGELAALAAKTTGNVTDEEVIKSKLWLLDYTSEFIFLGCSGVKNTSTWISIGTVIDLCSWDATSSGRAAAAVGRSRAEADKALADFVKEKMPGDKALNVITLSREGINVKITKLTVEFRITTAVGVTEFFQCEDPWGSLGKPEIDNKERPTKHAIKWNTKLKPGDIIELSGFKEFLRRTRTPTDIDAVAVVTIEYEKKGKTVTEEIRSIENRCNF